MIIDKIKTENMSLFYSGKMALNNISITIPEKKGNSIHWPFRMREVDLFA